MEPGLKKSINDSNVNLKIKEAKKQQKPILTSAEDISIKINEIKDYKSWVYINGELS